MKKILIGLGVLIIAAVVVGIIYAPKIFNKKGRGIACTMEAKLCSDGSAVGRVGPNCEFALCPSDK